MLTYFLGGAVEMLTVADMGEGAVKNQRKNADVLDGQPHACLLAAGLPKLGRKLSPIFSNQEHF